MNANLRLLSLILLLMQIDAAQADLIQLFSTDDSDVATFSLAGDTYTRSLTGLVADGVSFDAELTVVGSDDVNVLSTGIGVGGDLVDPGESLRFTLAISNFAGGVVAFDGFTEVDFNSFGNTDFATLSIDDDALTIGDNFFIASGLAGGGPDIFDISGTSPPNFTAFPTAGNFRIDDVSGSFTGTASAVPEPTSGLLLLAAIGGHFSWRHRRKFQRVTL